MGRRLAHRVLNAVLAGVQAGVLGGKFASMAASIGLARTQQGAIFSFMHLSRHIRMCQLDTNGQIHRKASSALFSRSFLPPFVEAFRASLVDMQEKVDATGDALGLGSVANVDLANFINAPVLQAGVDVFANSSAAQPVDGGRRDVAARASRQQRQRRAPRAADADVRHRGGLAPLRRVEPGASA